jgi:hypothetical protein
MNVLDYEPFGEEWELFMMRNTKKRLVEWFLELKIGHSREYDAAELMTCKKKDLIQILRLKWIKNQNETKNEYT